ncbi:ATP dependent DNA ligase domain protein [Aspergillus alliaceus]|uniref:ATP dependent DNA ligase domain protein n=1 Tax=Petromyces alliaceus TaxID=209559 RepID=UPI0012A3F7E0|nr:putative ATP-dependent DNA ligase [Aspergillus alliaceus]KAB8234824.1 putative ATP-dependent DNA ligase [Aspergillus alliaceus]
MGFKFSHLCDLLSSLENNKILKATTEARNHDPDVRTLTHWFQQHGKRLRDKDTDQLAVLSCMFPEKRVDRVYWLKDTSLARVIGRCLLLGSSRREELDRWRASGGIDLAQCVENVMRQAENHILEGQEVTVEEIDAVLNRVASRCRFSGPRLRRQRAAVDVDEALSPLYRRLHSRDAKWLTRMILKSYSPVVLPLNLTLRSFHFLLPHLLLFQDSFEAMVNMLAAEPISHFPPHPEPGLARDLGIIAMQHLSPVVGVKIGRPDYYKARSIKHCCQMIGRRRMSMERKYDGEYCQIHIDLSKHSSSIRIFSKSGKDSTADRSGVHQVIRDSLRIGKPGCKFSRRCILEGELLVWSDRHGKIMDFHKLRKFITRSGTFIGTEGDSPPQLYEHLMIVFFDILLLDDDVCLRKPHRERRLLLKDVIQVIAGRADISEQRVLDFCRPGSQSQLESIFAKGVAERWEGFVLKGCEEPYFTTFPSRENGSYGRWIKLKKDYIPGLGDTVDLAIIGGRYDSRDAVGLKQINKLSWTHFFIGCLVNKDAVLQSGSKPKFRAVDLINHHCMSVKNMQILNQFGEYSACGIDSGHGFDIEYGANNLPRIDAVFKTPFVVEMLGSGFEKPSGARYYTLRFPRILKIHWDRSFEDAASFKELQLLAEDARSMPSDELLEENEWNKRLKLGNGSSEYIINRSQSLTSSSGLTQSPVKGHILNGATQPAVDGTSIQNYSSSPVKEDSEGPPALARPIPIYVDETIVSISSDNSDIHGNFLTTNDNLSSHQISYQKNNVSSTDSVKQKNSKPSDESENSNASTYSNMSSTQTNFPSTQDLKALKEHADILTCSSRINNPPPQKPLNPIKSLHMTLPIHIIQSNPPTSQIPKINLPLTYIPNMNTFLKSLTTPALGLLLLKPIETPLGPTLLDLTTALYKRLQPYSSNSPTSGKIFLLDSSFLDHGTVITDPRLSHRTRWEEIGRKHFYASVSWGSKGRIDEIPCTPSDGGYKGSLDLGPRVSIEFDRGALGIMELNGPLRVV